MAVGGGGSGLEVAAQAMSLVVLNSPEEWEKRRDALLTMQKAVEEQAEKSSGQSGGNPVFVADLWRLMKEPLKHTLVSKGWGRGAGGGASSLFVRTVKVHTLCS